MKEQIFLSDFFRGGKITRAVNLLKEELVGWIKMTLCDYAMISKLGAPLGLRASAAHQEKHDIKLHRGQQ